MDRKKWLEERKSGIGGSDSSSILGLNPYMSNESLELYCIAKTRGVDNG